MATSVEQEQKWRSWALVVAALILSAGLLGSTVIVANTITYVKTLDSSLLTVTGSAEEIVTSDQVKWPSSFSVEAPASNLQAGYATMARDRQLVLAYLTSHGVAAQDITVFPVIMMPEYNSCLPAMKVGVPSGAQGCVNEIVRYRLTQDVQVNSGNVVGITKLAQDSSALINEGVVFSSQRLEYFYSKLPALRVQLLGAAIKDAQHRAQQIAGNTGAHVGRLITASSGVVQVTPVNSTQVSSLGTYDTTTVKKQVTAVIRASFALQP
ncbi:MAG: SIMPL domain-containing protein [Chloroflexi bacterium]|nr:SIMPL domain-containing protein [Chloroflexota bacterium]